MNDLATQGLDRVVPPLRGIPQGNDPMRWHLVDVRRVAGAAQRWELGFHDILGHGPSVALFHIKGHFLTFGEGLEPRHVYGGVVNKYVLTVFLLNKTISFLITEPLYDPFCQNADLLLRIFVGGPDRQVSRPNHPYCWESNLQHPMRSPS